MSRDRIPNRFVLFLAVIGLVAASGCTGTTTVTAEAMAATASSSSTEAVAEFDDSSTGDGDVASTLAAAPTSVSEPAPDPTGEPEPAADGEPSVEPTPGPSSETSALLDQLNRPLDERIAALAAIDEVAIDPKRMTDRVSLDSSWWGLGSDVYPGDTVAAGPIPEIGDPAVFCGDGHLEGSPRGTGRASRNWTARSDEYRAITVGSSAMLSGADAADSIQRYQLLLENCDGIVTADGDTTMQVVDLATGRFLVLGSADSDFVLVYTRFAAGSLTVTVSAGGDASILEQLIADTEYARSAAVDAVEGEIQRVGAVAQLRPDLQEDLAQLDGYCRGHDQWDTSIGLTRTPLEYFEDIVGYFDGVEAPQELGTLFDDFRSANAEILEVVRGEGILTEEDLGEHPAWIELRERYAYTDAMTTVRDFGRENC